MYQNITKYKSSSIFPERGLSPSAKVVIIVITRWHDIASRKFLRNTLRPMRSEIENDIQLLFVFGIPETATEYEIIQIEEENKIFQDMIIPG